MNDGQAFEEEVEFLLRLRSDCEVQRHRLLAGKDSDLLLLHTDTLLGPQRIAVECKNHNRPLSRRRVAAFLSDYRPILESGDADALLLVTRNGIVANAEEALQGVRARHLTERELLEAVISTERLLRDAEETFTADDLDKYYQPTVAHAMNVTLAAGSYDLYYSQLTDFAVELTAHQGQPPDFAEVENAWRRATQKPLRSYSPEERSLFSTIIRDRSTRKQQPLDEMLGAWLRLEPDHPYGFAVLGSYGTGKSSFARALVAAQAKRYRTKKSARVPLLIELRHFGSHQSIEGLIADELSNRHGLANASFTTFQALNKRGRFLLVLDGFDEMKEGMSRDALVYNFSELNRLLVGAAKVVLCGRPTIFENQDEQRSVMTGTQEDSGHARARYVQVTIAPMALSTVQRAISRFVDVRRAELSPAIDRSVAELQSELKENVPLQHLLARPVHYPMLLRVLPDWAGPLTKLTRTALYGEFIDQTISREMKPGRLPTITTERRRRFAADLAVAMMAHGDSRGIRHSAIPDEIVAPHRRGSEPLEATRRDLVKSCFLERKSPDILFFPHKSFAEYLVALRISDEAKEDRPDTSRLRIRLTEEIMSFLDELFQVESWGRLLGNLGSNLGLVRSGFAYLGGQRAASDEGPEMRSLRTAARLDGTFHQLNRSSALLTTPEMVQYHMANGLEHLARDGVAIASTARDVLWSIAWQGPDFAAIHAFRALAIVSASDAARFVGRYHKRWESWVARGWISRAPVAYPESAEAPSPEVALRMAYLPRPPQERQ